MKVEQLHPTSQDSKRNEIVEVAMNFFGMHRTSEKVFFFFPSFLLSLPIFLLPSPFFFLQYHVLSIEICFRVFSVNKRSKSMENTVLETAEKSSDLRFILSNDRCAPFPPLFFFSLLVSFQLSLLLTVITV